VKFSINSSDLAMLYLSERNLFYLQIALGRWLLSRVGAFSHRCKRWTECETRHKEARQNCLRAITRSIGSWRHNGGRPNSGDATNALCHAASRVLQRGSLLTLIAIVQGVGASPASSEPYSFLSARYIIDAIEA